jgi:thiol-disulfide isomerase/thioredoxin
MFKSVVVAASLAILAGTAAGQVDTKAPPKDKQAQTETKKDKAFDLMVGDKAPALQVEKWVKGEPVTGFEKGKVYVVEFWATWCGPCIASMPHLSELQSEYKGKGVTIIGVTSADPNNSLEDVEKMVEEKGDTMGYTVAWDTERKTNAAYMKAAGQRGIPCSFVVDRNGVVAYIGHPGGLDKPLKEIVAGTYDLEKAKASYARARENEKKMEPVQRKLFQSMQTKDWDAALAAVDEAEKLDPEMSKALLPTRFQILLGKGDTKAAYGVGRQILEENNDNPMALNTLAWTIIDPEGDVEDKDVDLALRAAERAAELTKHKDAAILDTLALAHFLKGNTDKAIDLQTKAVDLAEGPMKEELESRLKEFKEKAGK